MVVFLIISKTTHIKNNVLGVPAKKAGGLSLLASHKNGSAQTYRSIPNAN